MNRFFRLLELCLVLIVMCPSIASASGKEGKKSSRMNWEPVMNAIIQVESGGRTDARNGNQCGAMQITPIAVKECNFI